MTLSEALRSASNSLSTVEIEDALVEAELLLGYVLGVSKAQLYSQPERSLTAEEAGHLQQLVQRRLLREPTAYILKRGEFYGFDFYLDRRVLIPRPESELLVEKTIEFASTRLSAENGFIIADIGTGCGAVAISLALSLPEVRIYATDISDSALQVASVNCRRHKVGGRVKLLQGDLLEPLPELVDVIVANLPYIRDCEFCALSPEIVDFEPVIALSGGEDGLDKIRCLLQQAPGKIRTGGCLLLEAGQGQDKAVSSIINSHFPPASIELIPDLSGINRVMKVVL